MSNEDEFPLTEIKRTPIDSAVLRAFTSERQHLEVAFNLLRELAKWTIVLGSAYAGEQRPWSIKESIYAGHFIRLGKLLRAYLSDTSEHRGEIAWITLRVIAECAINLRFLLANESDEVIRSYLMQSLQHERDLLEDIKSNIDSRGGRVLPIEQRMLRSIERHFANSLCTPEELPQKRIQNWANLTLREKARSLGLDSEYKVLIAGASRNVHGNWADLLQHHLKNLSPGYFEPNFEVARIRPQALFALCILVVPACIEYLRFLAVAEADGLQSRLDELLERVRKASDLHEGFLVDRQLGT